MFVMFGSAQALIHLLDSISLLQCGRGPSSAIFVNENENDCVSLTKTIATTVGFQKRNKNENECYKNELKLKRISERK